MTLQIELTKSHAELQEFIRNEQVVGLIEEVLDNIESKFIDDPVTLLQSLVQDEERKENIETIASTEVTASDDEITDQHEKKNENIESISAAEVITDGDENNDLDESYLYVDESLSKCMKRQMNESIMSVGDPMFTESRKLKHQQSFLECTGSSNDTVSICISSIAFTN